MYLICKLCMHVNNSYVLGKRLQRCKNANISTISLVYQYITFCPIPSSFALPCGTVDVLIEPACVATIGRDPVAGRADSWQMLT